MTTDQKSGFLPSLWRRLFGERAHTLREEEGHTSLAGMVLLIILSAAMVVVFGHAELPWLLTGTLPVRVLMAGSLAILALGTFVADQTALRSMLRMPILARNRAAGMLWEHALYVGLVIATEMLTYILALYVIESDPTRLLSTRPILPGGIVAIGLLALRGLIIGWTLVQSVIVKRVLPPQWETAVARGQALVGGHLETLLAQTDFTSDNLPAVLEVMAEMTQPPIPRRRWWNGSLIRIAEEEADKRRANATKMIDALRKLTTNQEDVTREMEERIAAIERERDDAFRAVSGVRDRATNDAYQTFVGALFHLMRHGELPASLVEMRPELADFALSNGALSALRSTRKGAANGAGFSAKEPRTLTEKHEAFLAEMGIPSSARPDGKRRGIWVRKPDAIKLLRDGVPARFADDKVGEIVRRLGGNAMVGTSLVAPIDQVMGELLERHLASDTAREAWARIVGMPVETTEKAAANERGNDEQTPAQAVGDDRVIRGYY